MKREKKAERDTALWLNDDQESLLVEHKRRIKQQDEQRRAEQERCRTEQRRVEQQKSKEAEEAREKEKDRLFEAIKARAEITSFERERKQQDEQRRGKQERRWDEQRRIEQERRWDEQRRIEQERRRDEQRRAEQERQRFSNLFKLSGKAMNTELNVRFPLPKLKEDDIQLVEKWYPLQEKLDGRSLIDVINDDPKDWDSGRLLSARSAEKIAICFYRHYGKKVKDISITQLNENNNSDWRDYDLNVDGRPVDVKNSRKSQNSEDRRYTEYCIPKFKEDRTSQKVIISGVFSPYLWPFELLGEPKEYHQDREIRFLGETTLEKQQELKNEFNGDLVYFSEPRSSGKYFLPPWIFDYPKYIYTERDEARKELKDFSNLDLLREATTKHNLIPVAIAAGIDLTKILDKKALGSWEWSFLEQLNNRIEEYGLSLPFLFLTILSHFLAMASSSETVSDFNPNRYRKFLFYKNNKPLGIYDPLKTIDALIKALSILWTAENGLIRKFRMFKLMSFNILQGKHDRNENTWTTLIAYCGGHLENGSSCGKNPLVLGKSELCECRRLICPDCGFCCEDEWGCGCKRRWR